MAHYLLWKTGKTRVSMPQWSIDLEFGRESLGETLASLRQLGHGIGRDERQRLGDELARALDVNSEGLFYYLSLDQLRELDRLGIDLQLHTHRHRFDGIERSEAREEVTANRAYLDHVRAVPRRHFCYPSGAYTTPQLTWLRELDVLTATTCEPGLNYPDQDRLQLNRILDSQDIPEVWFKALLDGLPFFARSALSRTRRRAPYVG
jgi:peptidoglycan/xylan/chitin deacetylase (PgdA/CDA1 family)